MTNCLSDEDVLAFALGRLPEPQLASAHLHLDECEICQRLLSEAAHALAMAATAPLPESEEVAWHTTFRPGALVGQRYWIRRFIVRGGMGEVYEAFDQDLHQRIALKTVTSTACDNPSAVRLLKAEVQLARRVSHPNVCRIYDFGSHVMPHTGAQISFLTMEFVEGETLGQRIRLGGALPVEEARSIGRELLQGLSAAHDANVLHHDLKSDNVMLRNVGEDGVSATILDFGLARALEPDARSRSSATNGSLRGTFGYMAPEQLENKPYTKASDVYALGIVWFEMLTGELPFESSSSPTLAVLERVQRSAPAPSTKNPAVPRDLDAIVLGCLRRSPKDRYRTAGEVLTALDELEERSRAASRRKEVVPVVLKALSVGFALGLGCLAAYLVVSGQARMLATLYSARPSANLAASLVAATLVTALPASKAVPPRPALASPSAPAPPAESTEPKPKPKVKSGAPRALPRAPNVEQRPVKNPDPAPTSSGTSDPLPKPPPKPPPDWEPLRRSGAVEAGTEGGPTPPPEAAKGP